MYLGDTPCESCQPSVHPYNVPVIELYTACSDQVITGPTGIITISDIAITNAMREYFEVDQKDKLIFSKAVRAFSIKVNKEIAEINKQKQKTK